MQHCCPSIVLYTFHFIFYHTLHLTLFSTHSNLLTHASLGLFDTLCCSYPIFSIYLINLDSKLKHCCLQSTLIKAKCIHPPSLHHIVTFKVPNLSSTLFLFSLSLCQIVVWFPLAPCRSTAKMAVIVHTGLEQCDMKFMFVISIFRNTFWIRSKFSCKHPRKKEENKERQKVGKEQETGTYYQHYDCTLNEKQVSNIRVELMLPFY